MTTTASQVHRPTCVSRLLLAPTPQKKKNARRPPSPMPRTTSALPRKSRPKVCPNVPRVTLTRSKKVSATWCKGFPVSLAAMKRPMAIAARLLVLFSFWGGLFTSLPVSARSGFLPRCARPNHEAAPRPCSRTEVRAVSDAKKRARDRGTLSGPSPGVAKSVYTNHWSPPLCHRRCSASFATRRPRFTKS